MLNQLITKYSFWQPLHTSFLLKVLERLYTGVEEAATLWTKGPPGDFFSYDLSQELLLEESTLLMGDKWFLYLNYPCKFSLDFSYPVSAGTRVRKKMLGVQVEVKRKEEQVCGTLILNLIHWEAVDSSWIQEEVKVLHSSNKKKNTLGFFSL